jgi:hypothetical protein
MSTTQTIKINVEKAATTKINDVDFENLKFGSVFTSTCSNATILMANGKRLP